MGICNHVLRMAEVALIIGSLVWQSPDGFASERARANGDHLRVIAEGCLHNRESFGNFKCAFRVIYGKAKSEEEALTGRVTVESAKKGLWIVKDGNTKFELTRSPSAKPLTLKDVENSSPSQVSLSDGLFSLSINPDLGMGNIFHPDNPGVGIMETPFDYGMMGLGEQYNPGRSIKRCLETNLPCEYQGVQHVEGRPMSVVWLYPYKSNSPDGTEKQYLLDLGRGFIPIRVIAKQRRTGFVTHKAYVTKIQECSGGRWFPTRTVRLYFPH